MLGQDILVWMLWGHHTPPYVTPPPCSESKPHKLVGLQWNHALVCHLVPYKEE